MTGDEIIVQYLISADHNLSKITEQSNEPPPCRTVPPPGPPQQESPACQEGERGQPDCASPGDGGPDCPDVLQDRQAMVLLSVGHTRTWTPGIYIIRRIILMI